MNDEERTAKDAIDIVARHALIYLVEQFLSDEWDAYPDIGEDDWETIVEAAHALVVEPSEAAYDKAYEFLAARADNNEPGS